MEIRKIISVLQNTENINDTRDSYYTSIVGERNGIDESL